jgi:hypothetical protein
VPDQTPHRQPKYETTDDTDKRKIKRGPLQSCPLRMIALPESKSHFHFSLIRSIRVISEIRGSLPLVRKSSPAAKFLNFVMQDTG